MTRSFSLAPVSRPLDAEESRAVRAWADRHGARLRRRRVVWLPLLTAALAALMAREGTCAPLAAPALVWAWASALGLRPGSPRTTVSTAQGLRRVTGTLRSGWRPTGSGSVATPDHWTPIDGEVEALVFLPVPARGDLLHRALDVPLVLHVTHRGPPPRVWSVGADVRAGRVAAADVEFRLHG